jgi:UPF0716 protein FxsA
MTEVRLLLTFLDRDFLFKIILILLLYSLVPLAEIFLFLALGNLIGNYLTLALAAVAGVAGALLALGQVQRTQAKLREKIRKGEYPGREFADLAGMLAGGLLLITPGFITDLFGYGLMIPFFREALGRAIVKKLDRSFRDVYEYLRLRV